MHDFSDAKQNLLSTDHSILKKSITFPLVVENHLSTVIDGQLAVHSDNKTLKLTSKSQ